MKQCGKGGMEVECTKCMHSFEVEDTTKKYRFPLFFISLGTAILAYEYTINNPSQIVTVLGNFSVTVGIIWMAATKGLTGGRECNIYYLPICLRNEAGG
ncbi:MAG: hypothetical protein ACUZ9M_05235 [Candidatus Scalindua sp.]